LSKKKQKKSGNKKDQPASAINLITAIVNLVIAILLLIEKLTR
jgi:diacylglycerol kinase